MRINDRIKELREESERKTQMLNGLVAENIRLNKELKVVKNAMSKLQRKSI